MKTETKFQLTKQIYRYMFDNASDAMWVHDLDGHILAANRACELLTGYHHEELIGTNQARFITPESTDTFRKVERKLLEGEEFTQPYEKKLIRKDGAIKVLQVAASLVLTNGVVAGVQHVARDVTREKQLEARLRLHLKQITRAQEDERKRIAQEVHDETCQPLLVLIQRMDTIISTFRPGLSNSLKDALEALHSQAVEALEALRRCAQDLRPRILDDLGLIPALEWMGEEISREYGVDALVEVKGSTRELTPERQLLLFRIAQEALTNTQRHAEASIVWVTLKFADEKLNLEVKDNGRGFEVPGDIEDLAGSGRLGLVGMKERAELIGAKLRIQSGVGKGTTVAVVVPL